MTHSRSVKGRLMFVTGISSIEHSCWFVQYILLRAYTQYNFFVLKMLLRCNLPYVEVKCFSRGKERVHGTFPPYHLHAAGVVEHSLRPQLG